MGRLLYAKDLLSEPQPIIILIPTPKNKGSRLIYLNGPAVILNAASFII